MREDLGPGPAREIDKGHFVPVGEGDDFLFTKEGG